MEGFRGWVGVGVGWGGNVGIRQCLELALNILGKILLLHSPNPSHSVRQR